MQVGATVGQAKPEQDEWCRWRRGVTANRQGFSSGQENVLESGNDDGGPTL